jgi:hypothetical protein
MKYFNAKLAPYLEDEKLDKILNLSKKPVSLRYIARRFNSFIKPLPLVMVP